MTHTQTELPEHPGLRKGVLPNGLRYAILRNAAPPGRFDAFLEIFAGSADELEKQQGMAHIVEHISYMGSRKRCVCVGNNYYRGRLRCVVLLECRLGMYVLQTF
jgi:hypothetical protein